MKSIATTLALALFATPFMTRATHAAPTPDAYVVLTELGAKLDRSELVIDVTVDDKSWGWAGRQKIPVTVNVEARLEGGRTEAKRFELRRAKERLVVRLPDQRLTAVDVGLEGDNGKQAIAWFELGGLQLVRARLKVAGTTAAHSGAAAEPPRAAPAPAIDHKRTVAACDSSFSWEKDRKACVRAVASVTFDPAPSILTCAAMNDFEPDRMECIRVVAAATRDPSEAMTACAKRRFFDDDERLACVRTAAAR